MSSDRKMGHVQDLKVYVGVLLALFVLTVVTVLAAGVDFGIFNNVIAVGIAAVKATLVILFFMHGKYEKQETWAFIYYPIILLGILLAGLFLDYGAGASRTNKDNYLVKPESIVHSTSHGDESHGDDSHGDASGDDHAAPADGGNH